MKPNDFQSAGRNPNQEPTCSSCRYLSRCTDGDGGWCNHPRNRVNVRSGVFPNGFAPSVFSTGGCSLHSPRPK